MYPSQGNGNSTPIPYHDITIPMSKQELHPSPSLLDYFSSPSTSYFEDHLLLQHLNDLFLQHQPIAAAAPHPISAMEESVPADIGPVPRRRSSKKDRHSKIDTAQGQRDRRMRLSLEVAREFFDLQDTLGFDKPSKTIKWLLSKSKAAIKELTSGANSASSVSEGEVVSEINHLVVETNQQGRGSRAREKKSRSVRKSVLNTVDKEAREKARARARERTREKRRVDGSAVVAVDESVNDDHINIGGPWNNLFENGEQLGFQNPSLEGFAGIEEPGSSIIFTHDHHENQFTDFQIYGKLPWEAYNNANLY